MRALISFGFPIDVSDQEDGRRFNDMMDDWGWQRGTVVDFQNLVRDTFEAFAEGPKYQSSGLRVSLYSELLLQNQFMEYLDHDTMFVFYSMVFVLFYFIVHLRSILLGFISILLIILSFAMSNVIYCGIM